MPSYQNYLNWLQLLFDMLNIGGPLLMMGNSFGAVLGRFFAAENTSYVSRLVLIDGGAIIDAPGCMRPFIRLPILSNPIFNIIRQQAYSSNGLKRAIADEKLAHAGVCRQRSGRLDRFRGGSAANRADGAAVTAHAHLPHAGDLGRAGSADLSGQRQTSRG